MFFCLFPVTTRIQKLAIFGGGGGGGGEVKAGVPMQLASFKGWGF